MGDSRPLSWRGKKLNAKTILMLQATEQRLGRPLTLIKGSFDPSPGRSKGTHDKGGAFDAVETGPEVIKALRMEGFAAYKRLEGGSFRVTHTHAVSVFDRALADEAKSQVTAYKRGRNGLEDDGPDPHPRVDIPRRPTRDKQTVKRAELRFNETNKSIAFLQEILGVVPDGFFGPQTQAAVQSRFQWDGTTPLGKTKFLRIFPGDVFKRES